MALKTYKPYTKSTRATVLVEKSQLWKGSSFKPLTKGQKSSGGRNNYGRIHLDTWVEDRNINLE